MTLSTLLSTPSSLVPVATGLPRVTLTGHVSAAMLGSPSATHGVRDVRLARQSPDAEAVWQVSRVRALLNDLADLTLRSWPRQALAAAWARTEVLLHLVDPRQPGRSVRHVLDCRTALGDGAPPQIALLPQHDVDGDREAALLQAGCVAVLALDAPDAVLRARLSALLRMGVQAVRWRDDARTDALTGLANRRQSDFMLERECLRASRHQQSLSLLLIDVDHFKRYNDTHGHSAGDECLRGIARVIARLAQRPTDCAARHGGEEFSLLLADTDADGAWVVAHRLLRGIRALRLPHGAAGAGDHVSVSIGIATVSNVIEPMAPQALIDAADAALYAAKREGRDRVCIGTGGGTIDTAMDTVGSLVVRTMR